jgi:hypothetical protein
MSKLKSVLVAVVVLSVFMVTPAFPQGIAGCRSGMFIGSYTTLITFSDLWGDGTNVLNQTIRQLTLHSDGTASQEDTAAPDIMLSGGTFSSQIGTWTCRSDGKLVVTLMWGNFTPTNDIHLGATVTPIPPPVDIILFGHTRATYLFSVTDANTLTRIQARNRNYDPTQDPTDPAGGVLGRLRTNLIVYKRLVASDADLLAP